MISPNLCFQCTFDFSHVDDIDLFPAGIAERSLEGGLVGPTFACLLGRQFQDLRQGDRYWYENAGPFQFTPGNIYFTFV
jgi:peroxidase